MSVSVVQLLTNIADAIREKKGTTGKINAQNMAFEIKSIEPPLDTITLQDAGKYNVKEYKYAEVLPSQFEEELRGSLEGRATEIHVPEGTTYLRKYAIYASVRDNSVTPAIEGVTAYIPTSLVRMDRNPFAFSTNLYPPRIHYAGTLQEWYDLNFALLSGGAKGYYLYINNELVTEINSITNFNKSYSSEYGSLSSMIVDKVFIPNNSTISSSMANIRASEIIFEGTISNGTIPSSCFYGVKNRNGGPVKIILPTNITTIPYECFSQSSLDELTIPEGVTTLGNSAFYITPVNKLILPSTLQTIASTGGVSYYGADDVVIVCKSVTPPTATGQIFYSNSRIKTIYIPAGTMAAYQSATNWATYSDLFVEMNEIALNAQAEILNNETYQYSIDGGVTWLNFTSQTINLSEIGFIKFKNTNTNTKLLIGMTAGATDIGSITDAELTYETSGSMTIYLRLEEITA